MSRLWLPVALLLVACADPPLPEEVADPAAKSTACEAQARGVVDRCGVPTGYYDEVDATSPDALRETLHRRIEDHRRITYNRSRGVDTWVMLEEADAEPGRTGWLRDVYQHRLYRALGGGYGDYDREHVWPKSYGFPRDNRHNYPYTDGHALYISDGRYNSSRNNRPFDWCTHSECEDRPIADGSDANVIHDPRGADGTWEVWSGRRGDIARAMFYLDVRYEGGRHRYTDSREPDLVLTDDRDLIAASRSTDNISLAYMGLKSALLDWHRLDPPDARERARNDIVAKYQGNRNPFVDHPEWAECLFAGDCGNAASTPPYISELHYDNAGADEDEFVEVAGPAGLDLEGWTLALYNGRDGKRYAEVALDGRIDDDGRGAGARAFFVRGLQNGGSDGVALVDPDGAVVEFLSYEGTLRAVDGPASGETSVDIGVEESNRTPVGTSLGRDGVDGDWMGPISATPGWLR